MARVVIYGLSIRADRTDRQKGYTVCKVGSAPFLVFALVLVYDL